jgi:hypothetical protein
LSSNEIADAIGGTLGDLFGDVQGDAPEAPSLEETMRVEEPQGEAWDFSAGDLYDEVEEPAEDDVPDFQLEAEQAAEEVVDDNEVKSLQRQLEAVKRKAEFESRRYNATARRGWEADVRSQPWGQFLPEDLSSVTATSHREYLRQVRQLAKQGYEYMRPHLEKLSEERSRLAELAEQRARAEVQAAWGRPTVGGSRVPDSPAQQTEDALVKARGRRSMKDAARALIESGEI